MRTILALNSAELNEILAVHLVVDVEREPAAGPVGLPLQLDVAAGDRRLDQRAVLVAIDDGAGRRIGLDHRHLQHAAGLGRDRQEDRVGLLALLAQGRQHDRLHLVVMLQHGQQHLVEAARLVPIGRRLELVLEAERIEEGAQPRVVGRAEARMLVAERIGHRRERLAEMGRQHLLVGHVVGHLAQPVHVVGEAEQPRRDVAQARGTPGAPWWCARPRRTCRYAAGRTGRSRFRTAGSLWPALCRPCEAKSLRASSNGHARAAWARERSICDMNRRTYERAPFASIRPRSKLARNNEQNGLSTGPRTSRSARWAMLNPLFLSQLRFAKIRPRGLIAREAALDERQRNRPMSRLVVTTRSGRPRRMRGRRQKTQTRGVVR